MEKINVAELLKDCPKGMELDCTLFSNVTFNYVTNNGIWIKYFDSKGHENEIYLDCEGCLPLPALNSVTDKCVIFPKGKTTWEGFQRPFKDGDILSYQCGGLRNRSIYIYRHHSTMNTSYYVALGDGSNFMVGNKEGNALNGYNTTARLATEEEKQKLFQAIKDNGYEWNAKTKTLEKLIEPKFKVGDVVKSVFNNNRYEIIDITDTHYTLVEVANKFKYTEPIIEDKYWKLAPKKFDITTLKPFDKVLVRLTKDGVWNATFFSHYDKEVNWGCYPFVTTSSKSYSMCIPYEQNKHLLGTTDDCDEFYKTWEQ